MSIVTTPDEFLYFRDRDETESLLSHSPAKSVILEPKNSPEPRNIHRRKLTEKGRQYALEFKFSKRNSAYKKLKEQINKIIALRDSPETQIETLEEERDVLDSLKEELNVAQDEYDSLLNTEEERESSYRWFDLRDREYIECRVKLCERMQALERRSYQSSVRSSHRSVKSHVSQNSAKSKSSITSSSSTKHLSIALMDVTAKTAKLKAEIKCLENERELRRLKLERDLAIANAEELAIKRLIKNPDESQLSVDEMNKVKCEASKRILDPEISAFVPKASIPKEAVQTCQQTNIDFAINQIIALQAKQTELSSLLVNQQRASQLPVKEPPVFSGEPFEYPAFITAFDSIIVANVSTERDRLYFLDKYTTGKANKVIKGFLDMTSDTAYKEARRLLDQRFGNPVHVAKAYKTNLRNWPQIHDHDATAIQEYSDFLVKCKEAMKTMQTMDDLDSTQVLLQVSAKLPSYAGVKWCKIAHDTQAKLKRVKFKDFVKIVKEEAELANDPIFSPEALKKERRKAGLGSQRRQLSSKPIRPSGRTETSQSFATMTTLSQSNVPSSKSLPAAKQSRQRRCPLCEHQHELAKCFKFLKAAVEERNKIVQSKGLCFGCLTPGHVASKCRSKSNCEECGKRHHTLLHGAKPKSKSDSQQASAEHQTNSNHGASSEKAEKADESSSNATSVTHTSNSNSSSTTNSRIVPVILCHKENRGDKCIRPVGRCKRYYLHVRESTKGSVRRRNIDNVKPQHDEGPRRDRSSQDRRFSSTSPR